MPHLAWSRSTVVDFCGVVVAQDLLCDLMDCCGQASSTAVADSTYGELQASWFTDAFGVPPANAAEEETTITRMWKVTSHYIRALVQSG